MKVQRRSFLSALLAGAATAQAYEFPGLLRGDMAAFAATVTERHGFAPGWVESILLDARVQQAVIRAVTSPGTARPWREFRPVYLTRERIQGGVRFWRDNALNLQVAQETFGVPAAVIVSIVGVETVYGRTTGGFRVLDALVTLAFEVQARAAYFQSELEQWLLLVRDGWFDARTVKGSYAGAMGWPQFMPSSLRRFAVDFDGDKRIDLWGSQADVVGSVANYLRTFGWKAGEEVVIRAGAGDVTLAAELVARGVKPSIAPAELEAAGIRPERPLPPGAQSALLLFEGASGPEYWLALDNFYVITRYNRSQNYALAVWQLAQAIAQAAG